MSINVSWDNLKQTVIRWDFEQQWTWHDVESARQLTAIMTQSVDHNAVDVIWDLRRVLSLPTPLTFAVNVPDEFFDRTTGSIIITNANTHIYATVRALTAFNRTLGYHLGFVDTLEEAREMLAVP